jgi:hypothetical protein
MRVALSPSTVERLAQRVFLDHNGHNEHNGLTTLCPMRRCGSKAFSGLDELEATPMTEGEGVPPTATKEHWR